MAQPSREPSWDRDGRHSGELPLDPDVDAAEDARHRPEAPAALFAPRRRSRWPRIRWSVVLAVAVGGFFGGIARYAFGLAWPTAPGAFPWDVFAVNTAGAFVLALLLVLVLEVLPPTTYLRPLVGTGFCGALTTFSSVVVGVDRLAADGHGGLAAGYVLGSLVAGLAAAVLGLVVGRSIGAFRGKGRG